MKRSNFAFTLAEVLITLAIIGVVAAMTIPTLVNKYQDRVNETRYKKALSMVSQAVQLAMAEIDSPGNMKNTDLWNCKDKDDVEACYRAETKKLFKSITLDGEALLNKMNDTDYYLSYNKFSPSYLLPMAYAEDPESDVWDSVDYAFQVADGMAFGYLNGEDGLSILLDTNGISKPNRISKDLYALSVGANGKVTDVTASLASGGSGCGEPPEWDYNIPESENNLAWDRYNQCKIAECRRKPQVHVSEGNCSYDIDYSESVWDNNTDECTYGRKNDTCVVN